MKIFILLVVLFANCSKPFPEDGLFKWVILSNILKTTPVKKYVFVSNSTHNGQFNAVAANAITSADAFCATEKDSNFSAIPGTGTEYKAMLASGTIRRACSTANCSGGSSEHINWVFAVNTEYYKVASGTDVLVFKTSASAGILNFGSSSLSNAYSSTAASIWTGLATDWQQDISCTSWTSSSGLQSGIIGNANATNNTTLDSTSTFGDTCDKLYKVLCVRQ